MKDYIQKVIHAFTASGHNKKLTGEVHQWLLNGEHADEKEAALCTLWKETKAKANSGTWNSLFEVYQKARVGSPLIIKQNRIKIWQYAAVAVIVLAISVSGTFFYTKNLYSEISMVEKFTPVGEMNSIILPDGSRVQTNSGTMLLYPETFKGDNRTVYLIGEANFKVAKKLDKPFIVKSRTMEVTALGTEFNISAYPDNEEMIATLIHGKIKVDLEDGMKSYILSPTQQVTYQNRTQQSVLTNADLEDVTAWQKGVFVFRGAIIKEILATLERRYAITFQYNSDLFSKDKYNFRFREKATIEDILAIIQEVVGGFSYKIEGDVCYIKSTLRKQMRR